MKATRTRLCIVGACGRMGSAIIREASPDKFEIEGAVESPRHPKMGKTLEELGFANGSVRVEPPSSLPEILRNADVCLSFTTAEAELENAEMVARGGRPAVIGTTGFTQQQREELERIMGGKVPVVMTPNFSVGANVLFAVASSLKNLPREFDVSIMEAHHSGKADAPSGTALMLGEVISKARGYSKRVFGRSGASKRQEGELEIVSLRGGGDPGEHSIIAFGLHEVLRFEHLVFSRSAFARGALLAAQWVSEGRENRVYGMQDVLGLPA